MKKLNIITLLCGLIIFITSCGGSTTAKSVAKGEVAIGNQVWTSKNLDVETYRNGDTIPQVQDNIAFYSLTTGAWCYHENKTANGTKYGKLYNWFAVNDPRGLAPKGYHIPTDEEWTMLTQNLEGAGDDRGYIDESHAAGTKMKSTSGWEVNGGNGSNTSGFKGLPGGSRCLYGEFCSIDEIGIWWCSSDFAPETAWFRFLSYDSAYLGRSANDKHYGLSVRCIKD